MQICTPFKTARAIWPFALKEIRGCRRLHDEGRRGLRNCVPSQRVLKSEKAAASSGGS
jgi:hypothetical protein